MTMELSATVTPGLGSVTAGVLGSALPSSSTITIAFTFLRLVPVMVTSSPVVASRLNVLGVVKPATNSTVGWAFTLKASVELRSVLPTTLNTLNCLFVAFPSACVV